MNYTPRQIDAWAEVDARIGVSDRADAIDVSRSANAELKDIRTIQRKMREQL